MKHTLPTLFAVFLSTAVTASAFAHGGRRFLVQTDATNQVYAQGYLSGVVGDPDGGGNPRAYTNALHDHFATQVGPIPFSAANNPGLDITDPELITDSWTLEVTDGWKWTNVPAMMPFAHTRTELDANERIEVIANGTSASTNGGQILLGPGNHFDLGFEYYDASGEPAVSPAATLFVVEFTLASDDPSVLTSDTIYAILSPDGATGVEKRHHASLYLERQLGTAIPEPGSVALLALSSLLMVRRRR